MRHCDGRDPNLVTEDGNPCTCGLAFDDVRHRVVHPHRRIPTPEERQRFMSALSKELYQRKAK